MLTWLYYTYVRRRRQRAAQEQQRVVGEGSVAELLPQVSNTRRLGSLRRYPPIVFGRVGDEGESTGALAEGGAPETWSMSRK